MSDDQFTLLFWMLLFVAVELFVIGSLIYTLGRGMGGWGGEWIKWKDNLFPVVGPAAACRALADCTSGYQQHKKNRRDSDHMDNAGNKKNHNMCGLNQSNF